MAHAPPDNFDCACGHRCYKKNLRMVNVYEPNIALPSGCYYLQNTSVKQFATDLERII